MKKLAMVAIAATMFTTILASCKKDETTPETPPSATITIASPTAGEIFQVGDTMSIIATIEGNVKMHGYDVAVVNIATGDTLFRADEHAHETTLSVDKYWCCTLSSATDLRLYISTALNHDGLEVVKTVDFKAAP